jgi:hypothetical protein
MPAPVLSPKRNAAPEMAARLLDGADLRLFLQPGETIKSRCGDQTYLEALLRFFQRRGRVLQYSYTEDPSVPKTVRSQLMATGRCKRFEWAMVDHGWEVVHDSAKSDCTGPFIDAIKACRRFKLPFDRTLVFAAL